MKNKLFIAQKERVQVSFSQYTVTNIACIRAYSKIFNIGKSIHEFFCG